MEDDGEGGGPRLSKRFAGGKLGGGEVDYKTKAGTAWSHSYLNQKPWHPLSYPNQRRKWIAEQTHAQRDRRAEEVAREFAQEQEFFRQTSLLSDKEKEKMEMMKAVSFMYLRPPGYNAESAKAAEIVDEQKKVEQSSAAGNSTSILSTTVSASTPAKVSSDADNRKARPKDVFGRALPTEEQFEVLKNAPRLETGVPARVKPFGVEIRNVRCVRCGKYGHQSGDRECPLKDAIMPNEESRLKRDDPLMAIKAQTSPSEPLKWELKQRPGMSPPRGGFDRDDPNQQIVAADEIFDEYGGFLSGGDIPVLLSNFNSSKAEKHRKRKHKRKHHSSITFGGRKTHGNESPPSSNRDDEKGRQRSKRKHKKRRRERSDSSGSEGAGTDHRRKRRDVPLSDSDPEIDRRKSNSRCGRKRHRLASGEGTDSERHHHHCRRKHRRRRSGSTSASQ